MPAKASSGPQSRPGRWLAMRTTEPGRPRVRVARYDSGLQQVHVIFRDGSPWAYDGVPQNVWRNFRRSTSPGRFINRVLNGFPNFRGGFSYASDNESSDEE